MLMILMYVISFSPRPFELSAPHLQYKLHSQLGSCGVLNGIGNTLVSWPVECDILEMIVKVVELQ